MLCCVKLAWLLLAAWRVFGSPEVCVLSWSSAWRSLSGSELTGLSGSHTHPTDLMAHRTANNSPPKERALCGQTPLCRHRVLTRPLSLTALQPPRRRGDVDIPATLGTKRQVSVAPLVPTGRGWVPRRGSENPAAGQACPRLSPSSRLAHTGAALRGPPAGSPFGGLAPGNHVAVTHVAVMRQKAEGDHRRAAGPGSLTRGATQRCLPAGRACCRESGLERLLSKSSAFLWPFDIFHIKKLFQKWGVSGV